MMSEYCRLQVLVDVGREIANEGLACGHTGLRFGQFHHRALGQCQVDLSQGCGQCRLIGRPCLVSKCRAGNPQGDRLSRGERRRQKLHRLQTELAVPAFDFAPLTEYGDVSLDGCSRYLEAAFKVFGIPLPGLPLDDLKYLYEPCELVFEGHSSRYALPVEGTP